MQDLRQGLAVHGWHVAEGPHEPGDPGVVDHGLDDEVIEWRQAHGVILQHLHLDATGAEADDGAENGVAHDADHEFAGGAGGNHVLHRDARDAGLGAHGLGPLHQLGVGAAHRLGIADIEPHPVHVGLVGEIRRTDLHHHRKAQGLGRHQGLVGGARRHGLHGRDAEGGKDGLGLDDAQGLAALGHDTLDNEARPFHVRVAALGEGAGVLHGELLVAVVVGQVGHSLRRLFRALEMGHPVLGEEGDGFGDQARAHPAG